ncbi:MAG TPA: uroporphyrinogen-III C-methyltransferase [Terriglobia bacterium]|nr:uroporphyrinogen-III C-methyltransferase [Terriglobia bacterium]
MGGKVYLVGAGPGDTGLLTLKGKAALERADVIIYDFLANEDLLRYAPPECEKICVGKRPGHKSSSQEAINELLVNRAAQGKVVVRLKGGDPFIFGRGGEEAQALAKAGIRFEIVPGITSGYAVPAYAGIPLTHRDLSSSVTFVTGHEDPSKPSNSVEWAKLAAGADTLVLFMGVRNLPEISAALIKGGKDPGTPAAVIFWGTRATQQTVTGSLADIAARVGGIEAPAIIVVGNVAALREELNWFERLPLFGRRIVTTRAQGQSEALRRALENLGAEAVEVPAIEVRDPQSWQPLDEAIGRLEEFDYLLFTSANGVRKFLGRLIACGRDLRDLKGLVIGAIGPGTSAELAATGIRADFLPEEYRAEGLIERLSRDEIRGKRFLIPRAKVARDILPRSLEGRGARVEVVEAYETVRPDFPAGELERLLTPVPDAITFTSSSTVINFVGLIENAGLRTILERTAIASIGPITSETVRQHGLEVSMEAADSTIDGLIEALQIYFRQASKEAPAHASEGDRRDKY